MKKRFTENDILRFLYGEMGTAEHDAFLEAIYEDDDLFDAFEEMKHAQASLSTVELQPAETSVSRVMKYAQRAAKQPRSKRQKLAYNGNGSMFAFSQLLSIVMVALTCLTVAIAIVFYQSETKHENGWKMTNTSEQLLNTQLDDRLEMAKKRTQNILNGKSEALVPMHHDTYRVVTSDMFMPQDENIVILQVR